MIKTLNKLTRLGKPETLYLKHSDFKGGLQT